METMCGRRMRNDIRVGSISTFEWSAHQVRYSPESDQIADFDSCRQSARFRHCGAWAKGFTRKWTSGSPQRRPHEHECLFGTAMAQALGIQVERVADALLARRHPGEERAD